MLRPWHNTLVWQGGAAAERIMRAAFSMLDDNVVQLRAQYACARRIVLFCNGEPVASAVRPAGHAPRRTASAASVRSRMALAWRSHGARMALAWRSHGLPLRPS